MARLRREAPNEPVVHFVAATLHRLDGEYEKALRSYDRLVRLDPAAHVVASYNRALVYIFLGRIEDAMAELDRAAATEPENPLLRSFRALALYYGGDPAAGRALMEEVLKQRPNLHGVRPILSMCLIGEGRHEEARQQLTDDAKKAGEADQDIAYWLASAYAGEGCRDEALEWLERAISLGNDNRPWFERDLNWSKLIDDPRLKSLLNRIVPAE